MQEISDDIGRFIAGRIDLNQLCENFRQTLRQDPSRRVESAAWLSQCLESGRMTPAVCESLRKVLAEFEPPPDATLTRVREPVGDSPVSSIQLAVGSFLMDRRYELQALLGVGGMGQVFKAFDHEMNRTVAVKMLNAKFANDPAALKGLMEETKRAQDLEAPNVIKVFNFERDPPVAFMLMEYLEGQTLEQVLVQRGNQPMPMSQAWPILKCIGEVLVAAHEQRVVHSDLKPSNVFVCSKGSIKVLDFGIARQYRRSMDATTSAGINDGPRGYTLAYASLEQILGQPADPRDDIYSFGVLAYRVLSGVHPFGEAEAAKALSSNLTPAHLSQLDSRQWSALRHALAFQRKDRTPSMSEVLRGLAPPSWLRKYRLAIVAAGLGIAGAVTYGAGTYLSHFDETVQMKCEAPKSVPVAKPVAKPGEEQSQELRASLFLARDYLSEAKPTDEADQLEYVLTQGANNVNQILDSVLAVDPSNQQALQMKTEVAALYLEKARAELRAGRAAVAAGLIREGRKVQCDNRDLFRLQREVCNASAAACGQLQN